MAKVAIVGVGAIGGAIAGFLEQSGRHEITLCTRRPMPHLTVHLLEREMRVRAKSVIDPSQAPAADWVLVATKTYDAEGAAAWFPALCAAGAPVAIVQNGVEHRERFAPYLDPDRLLPVVIDCPVERVDAATVRVRGNAVIKVEDGELGRSFASLFAGSDAHADTTTDFVTAAWWKLCVNSVGALNALTLKPAGALREPSVRAMALAMVAECAAVGRAEGAKLGDSIAEDVLKLYDRQPADSVNSLLADRLARRRMEWDARNGAIVRKGRKHRIETPLNQMAAALLETLEERPTVPAAAML